MQDFTDDPISADQEAVHSSSSLLDSKTSQLDDILNEKLEQAFHKQTSTVVFHDIAKIASEHSPVDLAYAASRLPAVDRPILYENLNDMGSKITFIMNTDSSTRIAVFRHIADQEVKKLIELMPPDQAVEVLEDISERRFRRVLELLDPLKATKIREINKHERNTAGRLMTNEFFAFPMDTTIGEVSTKIRDNPGVGLITKILVVNLSGELQGYVPARNLIINPADLPLRQVMRALSHKVAPSTSREEVIDLVERYKIGALPVVDDQDRPLGVITYEDVIEAIEDISDETIANMAGTTEKISEQESLIKKFFSRAPWILVTLCAGLVNVGVMSAFQIHAGGSLTFVLFFVPLITGMSGNIGIQCSTVLVRSMALGLISQGNKGEAILKELIIGVSTGLVFGVLCGILVFLVDFAGVAALFLSPAVVGMIVGVGLMGSCVAGTILGVFSPLFFTRMGVDPAVASGPIVTAFNDFLSMSIYFLIAIGLGSILL
ncbi:MAG: magnesium transporter [Chlamydiae bacterium]|nr:magnesium transporter [Chlamydiota bacterium]